MSPGVCSTSSTCRSDAPTWHEDVRSYDVVRAGLRLGRIHLDLHPRDGKFNHAACFSLAAGIHDRSLPEAVLLCNFSRGLLEHDEVVTFFHEFGHLVHDILAGRPALGPVQRRRHRVGLRRGAEPAARGVGVGCRRPRAPSPRNDAGEPIPAELVAQDAHRRCVRSRARGASPAGSRERVVPPARRSTRRPAGCHRAVVRQDVSRAAAAGAASLRRVRPSDRVRGVLLHVPVEPRDRPRPALGFGAGLMDPESAQRYRREILEPGGSRDARDLVEAFLGREYSFEAYREWLTAPRVDARARTGRIPLPEALPPRAEPFRCRGSRATSLVLFACRRSRRLVEAGPSACAARGDRRHQRAKKRETCPITCRRPETPGSKNVAVRRTPGRSVRTGVRQHHVHHGVPRLRQGRGRCGDRSGSPRGCAPTATRSHSSRALPARRPRRPTAQQPRGGGAQSKRSSRRSSRLPMPDVARPSNGSSPSWPRPTRAPRRPTSRCRRMPPPQTTRSREDRRAARGRARRGERASDDAEAPGAGAHRGAGRRREASRRSSAVRRDPARRRGPGEPHHPQRQRAGRPPARGRPRRDREPPQGGAGRGRGDPLAGAARRAAGAAADRHRAHGAQARLEREARHAAEKVSQAEQEAAAIRTEAEKGAAALRSMVARETSLSRAEAEEAVRELRVRALEFEESLTRRQDDAQQEFLLLHNQAVAHAERITQDANEQVGASLDHAQRLAAKADDFDRLMRAQAQQIEADANIRAREQLDRARAKAQKIIDTVDRALPGRAARRRGPHSPAALAAAPADELHGRGQGAHPSREVARRIARSAGRGCCARALPRPSPRRASTCETADHDDETTEHAEPVDQHDESTEHVEQVEFQTSEAGGEEPADHDERAEQHEYVEAASRHHES